MNIKIERLFRLEMANGEVEDVLAGEADVSQYGVLAFSHVWQKEQAFSKVKLTKRPFRWLNAEAWKECVEIAP